MRITDVQTIIVGNPWKNWLFVRLETDEGIYGIGEGTVNAFARTVETAIHELRQRFIGMDPFQIETLVQRMTRDVYTDGGQIHGAAVCAVETACWDIIGKAVNQPIYNLIGGRYHESLRVYANGWYRGDRNPETVARQAKSVVERGYTAMKFDPFGSAHRIMESRDRDLSIAIVEAVRDAVGPDVDLFIEGHCRFTVSEAIQIAERLAPFRPGWFEEPTHHSNIHAVVDVARNSAVPIATGESFSSIHQFAELFSHDAVHIVQPEPINLGGLWNCRKVVAMADAFYAQSAPHQAQGPVATAMTMHINASSPNTYMAELFDEFNVEWESQLVDHPAHVVDGYLQIPDRPGLGLDLNLDVAAQYPYREKNFLPLFDEGWERRTGASDR
jgi:galactonate dehydratase